MNENLILIGKIVRPRGLKGQVKVQPLTDYFKQFSQLAEVIMALNGAFRQFHIIGVEFHRGFPLLKLEGIDSIEKAQALVGAELYIKREQRPELPPDNFFFDEIAGSKVISTAGLGVGVLRDILHLPASDVLVIDRDGREVLIPFVKSIVSEIYPGKKLIIVIDMPSLWEEDTFS